MNLFVLVIFSSVVLLAQSTIIITDKGFLNISISTTYQEYKKQYPDIKDEVKSTECEDIITTPIVINKVKLGEIEWGVKNTEDLKHFERVVINNKSVITSNSIKVGTTVGELRKKGYKIYAGYDEQYYLWTDKYKNISFIIKMKTPKKLSSPDDIGKNLNLIPNSTVITSIIYFTK